MAACEGGEGALMHHTGSDGSSGRSPDAARSVSGERSDLPRSPEQTPLGRGAPAEEPLGSAAGGDEEPRSERSVARASLRGVSKRRAPAASRAPHEERSDAENEKTDEADEDDAEDDAGRDGAHRSARRRRGRPRAAHSRSEGAASRSQPSGVISPRRRTSSSSSHPSAAEEAAVAAPGAAGGRMESRHSSRYRGVQWDRSSKRWRARIHADRTRHIGYFERERDAGAAWDITALRHFGFAVARKLNFPEESLARYRAELQKEKALRASMAGREAERLASLTPSADVGTAAPESRFGLAIALEADGAGSCTPAGQDAQAHAAAAAAAPFGAPWSARVDIHACVSRGVAGGVDAETAQVLHAGPSGQTLGGASPMVADSGLPSYAARGGPHVGMQAGKAPVGFDTGPLGPLWMDGQPQGGPPGQADFRTPHDLVERRPYAAQSATQTAPGPDGLPSYFRPNLSACDLHQMQHRPAASPQAQQLRGLPFARGQNPPGVERPAIGDLGAAMAARESPYGGAPIEGPDASFAGPQGVAAESMRLGNPSGPAEFSVRSPVRVPAQHEGPQHAGGVPGHLARSPREGDWGGNLNLLHVEMQQHLHMHSGPPPALLAQPGYLGSRSPPGADDLPRFGPDGAPLSGHRHSPEDPPGRAVAPPPEASQQGAGPVRFCAAPGSAHPPRGRSFGESSAPTSTAVFLGHSLPGQRVGPPASGASYAVSPQHHPSSVQPRSTPGQPLGGPPLSIGGVGAEAGSGGLPAELAWGGAGAKEGAAPLVVASAPSQASMQRTWSSHAMRRFDVAGEIERSSSHPGAIAGSPEAPPGVSPERLGSRSARPPLGAASDIRALGPNAWVTRITFDLGTYPSQAAAEVARERAAALLGGLTFAPTSAVVASLAQRSRGNDTAVVQDSRGMWYAVLEIRGRFFKFGPFDAVEKAADTHDRCNMVLGGFLAPTVAPPWRRLLSAGELSALIDAVNATRGADGLPPLPNVSQDEAPRVTSLDGTASGGLLAESVGGSGSRESGAGPSLTDRSGSQPSGGAGSFHNGAASPGAAPGSFHSGAASPGAAPGSFHSGAPVALQGGPAGVPAPQGNLAGAQSAFPGYQEMIQRDAQSSRPASLAQKAEGDRDRGTPSLGPQTAAPIGSEQPAVPAARAEVPGYHLYAPTTASRTPFSADQSASRPPGEPAPGGGPPADGAREMRSRGPPSQPPSVPASASSRQASGVGPGSRAQSSFAGQSTMSGVELDMFCNEAVQEGFEATFLESLACVPSPREAILATAVACSAGRPAAKSEQDPAEQGATRMRQATGGGPLPEQFKNA